MELSREHMNLQEVGFVIDTVAEADGVLTPPVNLPPVYKVLTVDGRASASAAPTTGRVSIEGTVAMSVTYLSERGEMYAFESIAVFRHAVDNTEADSSMAVMVSASVSDIRVALTTGGVNMRAEIGLKCIGLRSGSIEVAVPRPELQCRKILVPESRIEHRANEIELREQMTLPTRAQTLLGTDAFARVDNVRTDPGRTLVSGTVRMNTSFVTPDGGVENTTAALPFECAFNESYGKAFASVNVQNLNCGLADNDIMFSETLLAVNLFGEDIKEKEVMQDAYCVGERKAATVTTLNTCHIEPVARRENVQVALPVTESMPQPNKVLSATVRPYAKAEEGMLAARLFINVIYASVDDGVHAAAGAVNVKIPMELEGETLLIVNADAVKAMPSGGEIALSLVLDVAGFAAKPLNYGVVDGMVDVDVPETDGPIIYFTKPGEVLWDIAKRFLVSVDDLARLNPGATESNVGERLLIG